MKSNDYSHEILDTFFETGKVLKISLKNGSVVTGMLVGFFHGEDPDGPYIDRWNFISEGHLKEYERTVAMNEPGTEIVEILQRDIEKVEFK